MKALATLRGLIEWADQKGYHVQSVQLTSVLGELESLEATGCPGCLEPVGLGDRIHSDPATRRTWHHRCARRRGLV